MTEGCHHQPPEVVVVKSVVTSVVRSVVTSVVTDDGSEADTRRAEVVVVTDDGQETKRRW